MIDEKYGEKAKKAVIEFLKMSDEVTRKWKGGSVLEEFGKARSHEWKNFNTWFQYFIAALKRDEKYSNNCVNLLGKAVGSLILVEPSIMRSFS